MAILAKVLKILGITLSVVVLALVIFLSLFNFAAFKAEIESAVSEATGRAFQINGDLSLKVLPTPAFLIENATLAGPEWARDPLMLDLGRTHLKVQLLPLLSRHLVVSQLEVENVQIWVEAGKEGRLNWDLSAPAEPSDVKPEKQAEQIEQGEFATKPVMALTVESAQLSQIRVTYRQPEVADQVYLLNALSVEFDDQQTHAVGASGQLADIPFNLSGQITQDRTELKVKVDEIDLAALLAYTDQVLEFDLNVSTLADLGRLLEISNLPEQDLALKGRVSAKESRVILSDISATTEGLNFSVDGEIDSAQPMAKMNLNLSVGRLNSLDPQLPDIPFTIETALLADKQQVRLQPYTVKLADSVLKGSASLTPGDTIAVQLKAESERLDLSPFMAQEADAAEKPVANGAEQEEPARYVFKDTPLPFEQLKGQEVQVDVRITHLITPASELTNLNLEADLQNGDLSLKTTFDGGNDGRFATDLELLTSGQTAALSLNSSIEDLKIALLGGDSIPVNEVPGTNLTLALKSTGGSPRALASNLNGRIVLHQSGGKVSNELVEAVSGDIVAQLAETLNPFASKEKFTNWQCSVFAMDFVSGQGEIKGFLMQSDKLMIIAGGGVDLNEEQLDFEFNTKPRQGVGISADMFVTPFVKLSGTLAEPTVGLNEKGVLLSGGAALLTGGMSFLYTGIMDRVTAQQDQCPDALAALDAGG